jgi:riboflavin synthase
MFTGIIQKVRPIQTARLETDHSQTLVVDTGWSDLVLGESIAVNGACLTVAAIDSALARFFVSSETLQKTNLGDLRPGANANLERALTAGASLSGHLVQGHVDGTARIAAVEAIPGGRRLAVLLPPELARYCVEKGSIAVNGVSLTVNSLVEVVASSARDASEDEGLRVEILLVPHTWENTQFASTAPGDRVNIEVDVLAKYVEAQLRWTEGLARGTLRWPRPARA